MLRAAIAPLPSEPAVSWKFLDISMLREIDLFSSLTDDALVELVPLTTAVEYAAGDNVFREGEVGDALYFILDGEIRISKEIPGVGEEALAFLSAGSYFGEMALVGDESHRSASAFASEGCRLARLERSDFLELLDTNKTVGVQILWAFVSTLSTRLRESNDKIAFFAMSNMFE